MQNKTKKAKKMPMLKNSLSLRSWKIKNHEYKAKKIVLFVSCNGPKKIGKVGC